MKRYLPIILATSIAAHGVAFAFTVNITAGTRAMYLQVGQGSFTGTMQGGGTPGNNATINVVSVTVPAASVGNNVSQAMTSNSAVSVSYWDGYAFCNPPANVYIGGFFRRPGAVGNATLTVSTAANLVNAGGDTIPFTEVSWVSTGNGDAGAEIIPSGTFTGGVQTLVTLTGNTWNESCHTFAFANTTPRAAGTYTGRATYTMSAP